MRRLALGFLGLASPLLLVALLTGGAAAAWVFVLAGLAFPVALIALGAAGDSRSVGLRAGLVALAVVLTVSGAAVVLTAGKAPAPGGGLPAAAGWMLAGLGLAPLILVVTLYAATFTSRHSGAGED